MKVFYFCFITLLILSSGCKKKGESLNQTVAFIGESKKQIGSSTFTITNIVDSRCPKEAICVREGNAVVSLKVQTDFNIQNFSLCIGNCTEIGSTDNITFTTGNAKYWVKLKQVSQTDEAKPDLPRVVTLEITKG